MSKNLNASFEGEADAAPAPLLCPACGALARRTDARFCATCGRRLADDSYFPTDALLSSYHHQRRRPSVQTGGSETFDERARQDFRKRGKRADMLFEKNLNNAAKTAAAFVVYALVPYLGILFCPGALVMGGVGLFRARRAPHLGGGRTSLTSIVLGLLLFAAHLVLWWILFKVPEWTRQGFASY